MLSASDLAAMQAVASSALDTACTIQRKTRTPDGTGHYSETLTTIATVQCNLSQPTAGQMQNYGYKIGALATWQVRVPTGTNVEEDDLLTINGQTIVVQVVLQPQSYQTSMRLLASQVE